MIPLVVGGIGIVFGNSAMRQKKEVVKKEQKQAVQEQKRKKQEELEFRMKEKEKQRQDKQQKKIETFQESEWTQLKETKTIVHSLLLPH